MNKMPRKITIVAYAKPKNIHLMYTNFKKHNTGNVNIDYL